MCQGLIIISFMCSGGYIHMNASALRGQKYQILLELPDVGAVI